MTMKGTICGRSYESQYTFLENRYTLRISYIGILVVPFNYNWREERIFKIVMLTLKREILFLFLVIYTCLALGINSKMYLGDRFFIILKKRQSFLYHRRR